MKGYKVIAFLISFLSLISIANAKIETNFSCEYPVTSGHLSLVKSGTLTCNLGYTSGMTLFGLQITGGTHVDCVYQADYSTRAVVKKTSTFNLTDYLKTGSTDCPTYIAIQTQSGEIASPQLPFYFTNDYNEAQQLAAEEGNYWAIASEKNADSELNDVMCQEYNEGFYNNLFDTLDDEITNFYNNSCDKFQLSESEKNSVASVDSMNKYEKCDKYLNYEQSAFNGFLNQLEEEYNVYKCFDESEYNSLKNQVTDYKNTYKKLENNLKDAFNGIDSDDNNDSDDSNDNDFDEPEEPDYKVDTSTNIDSICLKPSYRKPAKFIGIIVSFIKIIIPIILVSFGSSDLYKAMTSQKDDGLKKAFKNILIRIIAGVFIFLLPGIVMFILSLVTEWNKDGYKNAWCCCADCILNPNCEETCSKSCHIEGTN